MDNTIGIRRYISLEGPHKNFIIKESLKPEKLEIAYDKIYKLSNKYILVAEYFNPTPVTVNYRGHDDVLFKRDFAREILKKYDLEIIKYGFVWAQDPKYPLDDINWFLLKKK